MAQRETADHSEIEDRDSRVNIEDGCLRAWLKVPFPESTYSRVEITFISQKYNENETVTAFKGTLDERVHVIGYKFGFAIWQSDRCWKIAEGSERSSIIMSLSSPRYSYIDVYFRDTLLAHVE